MTDIASPKSSAAIQRARQMVKVLVGYIWPHADAVDSVLTELGGRYGGAALASVLSDARHFGPLLQDEVLAWNFGRGRYRNVAVAITRLREEVRRAWPESGLPSQRCADCSAYRRAEHARMACLAHLALFWKNGPEAEAKLASAIEKDGVAHVLVRLNHDPAYAGPLLTEDLSFTGWFSYWFTYWQRRAVVFGLLRQADAGQGACCA